MDPIEEHLSVRMKHTFQQYIRHAIEHALTEKESENDILQVIINLQASLELLSKLHVLRRQGWKRIVAPKYHRMAESEIIAAIQDGSIVTTKHWENKKVVMQDVHFDKDDMALLDSFHHLRNQAMHLGILNPSRTVLNEAIWFVVRVIHQLEWHDTLPAQDQFLSNSLLALLGEELYNKLMSSSCYVGEAVDRAHDLYPDDTKFCVQCGNETWARNDSGDRKCLVCGYKTVDGVFGFTDCPSCHQDGSVVYDAMNMPVNKYLNGKCCKCGDMVLVSKCPGCSNIIEYGKACPWCEGIRKH